MQARLVHEQLNNFRTMIDMLYPKQERRSVNTLPKNKVLKYILMNPPVIRTKNWLNFPKYVRRQTIARFLTQYEIFKKIIGIKKGQLSSVVFTMAVVLTSPARLVRFVTLDTHLRSSCFQSIRVDQFNGGGSNTRLA